MGTSASARLTPVSFYENDPTSTPHYNRPSPMFATSESMTSSTTLPRRVSAPVLPPPPQFFRRRNSWDESRDLVYSRILSAEEFLTRMVEQDEKVRTLSQMPDRDRQMSQITEILGLRGHLHNELVRIQRMLAEGDPSMKCIAEFEISNAEVIDKMREMRDEDERLKAIRASSGGTDAMTGTDLGPGGRRDGTTVGTNTDRLGRGSVGVQFGGDGPVGAQRGTMGTQAGGVGGGDGLEGVENEEDLRIKHAEEEGRLAAGYASRIARGRQMSIEEINALLGDHARNVQALKLKQDEEKRRLREKLDAKRRLRDRGSGGSDDGSSVDLNASGDRRSSSARQRRRERLSADDLSDPEHSGDGSRKARKSGSQPYMSAADVDGLLNKHSLAMQGLKSKQELEKQKYADILRRKKEEKNGRGVEEWEDEEELTRRSTDSGINDMEASETSESLQSIVQTLEALRVRGELTEDIVARLMRRYYLGTEDSTGAANPRERRPSRGSRLTPNHDLESASQLLQETQAKQKQIQSKRQQEKESVDEKLRQKLVSMKKTKKTRQQNMVVVMSDDEG